ncbi:MAG: hypothetical protein M1814_005324 [Vezdaea aestivalis]|nr:MAG: hypothetical protein M1814_005324 [Vezdaea aestivalis]
MVKNGRLFDNSLQSNLADEMQVVLDEVFLIADWMSTKGRGYQTGSQRIGFLYKALFGISDTDHAAEKVIAASFNDILKRKSTDEVTTTIYCEDDFIVKTGTDGEWINTITGDLYTGDTTEDHFECTDEVFGFALGPNVVVLCRRTLIDPWFTIGDRRSWHHVTSFHLDEYAAIATGVLLHELLHSASVLDDRKFRSK